MCGIVGAINWGDAISLERMNDAQRHRGPDDGGQWETRLSDGTWIGLGSRRLSIRDLSPAGHMPMSTPDGRCTIVYNGEVYNYPELRSRLEAAGYIFRSHSDTEAVLYLYHQLGPDCVKHLNGMFAFAVWDREREQLFMARDQLGIKPFYYSWRGNKFAFASEIKALLELPDQNRDLNLEALHEYLTFLWVPDPLTMFDGVSKLPAGYSAIYRRGKLELSRYWDLQLPEAGHTFPCREADLAAELRERFTDIVQRQMVSDVPLGAFLSAGIDSTCIVAAMSRVSDRPIRTFTITFPSRYRNSTNFFDDAAVARRTAKHLGCIHTEIETEPNVAELLPRLVWQMDEPIADPAILTCYLVNREARNNNITVLLAGNGGDELFAGYRKYLAHFVGQRYRMIPGFMRRRIIEPVISGLPTFSGHSVGRYVHFAKKMARSGSLPPQERFIKHSEYLSDEQKLNLYSAPLRDQLSGINPRDRHFEHFREVEHADFLNQMLYVDTKTFLVSLNLTYNDKMSMANSVEVRVPFLDKDLVQWAMSNVPPKLKLHGRGTKHILRQSMLDFLPQEVLRQPKAGFGAPVDQWLPEQLREMVEDLLGENSVRQRGLFSAETVRSIIDQQRSGQADWAYQIWQLLTLELWMRSYVDSVRPMAGVPA